MDRSPAPLAPLLAVIDDCGRLALRLLAAIAIGLALALLLAGCDTSPPRMVCDATTKEAFLLSDIGWGRTRTERVASADAICKAGVR